MDWKQLRNGWMCVRFHRFSVFKHLLGRVQESPTLDLARDYTRFVIAFFELISTSAPHIYISALPLSPPTSMVRKIYKQYARPLARVVHGFQASWDPVVAIVYDEISGYEAVWSPCNRFIAVTKSRAVEIRDAMTLNLTSNFEPPSDAWALSFSPDSRSLTQFNRETMVTWDLQTGVSVIVTFPKRLYLTGWDFSSAYSMDGKMLVAQYTDGDSKKRVIASHDFSTTHTHIYPVSEGHMVSPIWTHGEFLRFATVKSGRITIWKVGFTFTHPPEMVESLPTPDELIKREASARYRFLPTISRLAIVFGDTLLVWDARDSKRLLNISGSYPHRTSFSSDGRLFACAFYDNQTCIWKESPAGYIPYRKLKSDVLLQPLLSPNGELIILLSKSIIRLLHTKNSFLSSHPTLDMTQHRFILNVSSNDTLAAFVRHPENIVTILDLQFGNPQLQIDTGTSVKCLGVAGDTLVVADHKEMVTWKLAMGKTRANTYESIRITRFDGSPDNSNWFRPDSVSSDLSRIITVHCETLDIYDVSTGKRLICAQSVPGALKPPSTRARFKATDINGRPGLWKAWFTPDGREIWGFSSEYSNSAVYRWEVIEGSESDTIKLRPLTTTPRPPGLISWKSSRGYGVTYDGWVLSPTQKRLLWLPHHWRSVEQYRTWGGRFLGLFHPDLPEVVILEFLD